MKLKASILFLLALSPAFASARPRGATGIHMRPQVVRDRTPKVRVHTPQARSNAR